MVRLNQNNFSPGAGDDEGLVGRVRLQLTELSRDDRLARDDTRAVRRALCQDLALLEERRARLAQVYPDLAAGVTFSEVLDRHRYSAGPSEG